MSFWSIVIESKGDTLIDHHFETALEKIGRVLARQYNINVVFEGNSAYTDGKTITLPNFAKIPGDLKTMLSGFLDHEVGHCKFTEFPKILECNSRFHRELLNACEDVRIERGMIAEFPGCVLNLEPMNQTLIKEIDKRWHEIPIAIRLIHSIREIMEHGKPRHEDADIDRYLKLVWDDAVSLNECTNTHEVYVVTKTIIEKIKAEREEEKEGSGEEDEAEIGDESGDKRGAGGTAPAMPGDEDKKGSGSGEQTQGKDQKDEKSQSESGKGENQDSNGDKGEGEGSGEGEGDKEAQNGDMGSENGRGKGRNTQFDEMLHEPTEKEKSDYDKFISDVSSLINKMLEEHAKASPTPRRRGGGTDHGFDESYNPRPHIPLSVRFDEVKDDTMKGSSGEYARLMTEVKPHIRPIKNVLERVLKIRENARWVNERERGKVDVKNLGRFLTDKNFRTPFKEYTKTDVKNVAVELLIDMSGSMAGQKVQVAQQAAMAMGEALNELDIAFEVTGFHTEYSQEMDDLASNTENTARFNRVHECLVHHVFKGFDQRRLYGICEIDSWGNNTDGESVRWAAERLFLRKEKRKIMFVFCDGNPCSGCDSGILNTDLKLAVEQITKSGIELVGVGIQHNNVKRFYPNNLAIDKIADLPKMVMSKLVGMLEKGIAA